VLRLADAEDAALADERVGDAPAGRVDDQPVDFSARLARAALELEVADLVEPMELDHRFAGGRYRLLLRGPILTRKGHEHEAREAREE
jgi:hypothetical protein